jgi:glutaconate CoA-transferase, subunit B
MPADYTEAELLTVIASRAMKGVNTIFAGVGIPLLASILAKTTHAPGLTIVVEGGSIGPEVIPGRLPISTNEMRIAHRAQQLMGNTEIFLLTQRGYLEFGFIGGAQIDRFGNVNTSAIGSYEKPKLRLPGSGGANDIISLCRQIVLVTKHEKRRFVPKVDFITSPGYLNGGDSRAKAGLIFGRITQVITDLAIMDFDEKTKAMKLLCLYPHTNIEQVLDNTGFDLIIPDDIDIIEPPSEKELHHLRKIDLDRRYL